MNEKTNPNVKYVEKHLPQLSTFVWSAPIHVNDSNSDFYIILVISLIISLLVAAFVANFFVSYCKRTNSNSNPNDSENVQTVQERVYSSYSNSTSHATVNENSTSIPAKVEASEENDTKSPAESTSDEVGESNHHGDSKEYLQGQIQNLIDAVKSQMYYESDEDEEVAHDMVEKAIEVQKKITELIINFAIGSDKKDSEAKCNKCDNNLSADRDKEPEITFNVEHFKLGVNLEEPVGYEDVATELQTLRIAHEQPQLRNQRQNLQIYNRSMFLYGQPATGKTILAKHCAYKCGFAFIEIKPSLLKSKWVGQTSKNILKAFQFAKKHAPAIVFMDEVESLLCDRDADDQSSHEKNSTNDLLMEMNLLATAYNGVYMVQ